MYNRIISEYVIHNKHINCHDAMVLLAYSICRREKDVQLYSFSDQKDKLIHLSELPKTSLQLARNYCADKCVS